VAVSSGGDLFVADGRSSLISRLRARVPYGVMPATQAPARGARSRQTTTTVAFDNPSDIALAPNGDLLVADALHHRVLPHRYSQRPDHHNRRLRLRRLRR
jgi:hypothetical protein